MRRLVTIIMAVVVLSAATASGTIWYVPDDFDTIQLGIDSIPDGDTLIVRESTYYENLNFNGHNIVLASLFLLDQEPVHIESTIIDGSESSSVITFEGGEDSTAQVVGFTIQRGRTTGAGGGICCSNSNPTISDNTITGNTADYGGGIACFDGSNATINGNTISGNSAGPWGGLSNGGGGIYCANSSPTIAGNTISDNYANRYGGGVYCCPSSNPTITGNIISDNWVDDYGGGINCRYSSSPTISGNTISGNSASSGGGIFCIGSSRPTIENNMIDSNQARTSGGGIFCDNSSPTIENNTISGNSAGGADGGGIYCDNSSPMISNNAISGNSARDDGGGIDCDHNSNPTISGNSISGNSAVHGGGGILCTNQSSARISNNTITGNSAGSYGGGVNCDVTNPTISDNTISGNSADSYGGGISCYSCSPTVTNTILWGDTAPNGPEIYVSSGNPTVTYCDVEGGWPGEGNIDCDPQFCYPDTGNYYLHANSCCVGTGQGGVDIGALGVGCGEETFGSICVSVNITGDPRSPVQGALVTVIDSNSGGPVADPLATDENGEAFFHSVLVGDNYQVMIVTPLGYSVSPSETQDSILVEPNECTPVGFLLTPILVTNECRTIGYWKHQFNVYTSGRGNAQESAEDLDAYLDVVHQHFDVLEVYIDLENYDFEDAKNALTVRGGSLMNDRAKQQLFALFLNFASSRIGNETVVSDDGRVAAEAITLVAGLINDGNPENDELAKTVCNLINNTQMVSAGIIPESSIRYRLGLERLPQVFAVSQNYPNPFNASTVIEYQLPASSHVTLEVHNLLGRRVTTLVDERQQAGYRSVIWDASEVSSGLYFYKLTAGDYTETKRMMLVK